MGRLAQAYAFAATCGGIVALAAQTKPEDAMSNLGAWVKWLGLGDASLPANADTLATIAGLAVML